MKKIVLLLTICCTLIACKKTVVSFTYSPTAPRAGEAVTFTNNSSSGEEWEWQFGDGSTTTIKNPSHTYRKPGTYLVSLKVDKKKSLMTSAQVTVYDTIPTFVCTDTLFYIFDDYTFTAHYYNPYNYEVSYTWMVNDSIVGDEATLTTYFTEPEDSVEVALLLIANKADTFYIAKNFYIEDQPTRSLLLRTDEGDYRQRLFGERAETPAIDETATELLDLEQDTAQIYNGYLFLLSELQTLFPELEGFHISNRKIYYRAEGLWVANIDGAYPVLIDSLDCQAMTLNPAENRIYWANENGVWYMPFVGSDNNQFITQPTPLNTLNVNKLAIDNDPK